MRSRRSGLRIEEDSDWEAVYVHDDVYVFRKIGP